MVVFYLVFCSTCSFLFSGLLPGVFCFFFFFFLGGGGVFFSDNARAAVLPKIPQGLSTLLFRLWSEVPSGRGICGDSR